MHGIIITDSRRQLSAAAANCMHATDFAWPQLWLHSSPTNANEVCELAKHLDIVARANACDANKV